METPTMTRSCAHCGQPFQPRPQVPNQTYCSSAECQRARKLRWQQDKLRTDPDYRDNQRDTQRAWFDRHPGYWRAYYLLPRLDFGQQRIHLADHNSIEFESYRFDSLDYLYGMAERSRLRRVA
jgi:endogenous inhibitor of DNA gyrase (YacG/DUF329 family)